MIRGIWFRALLVLLAFLLILVFPIGGGFGAKTNDSTLNTLPLAHFAHRASDAVFPENCTEGIEHAQSLGYTGVEVDVRETKDQVFVLIHDDSCRRLLGLMGLVEEKNLRELLSMPLRRHSVPTPYQLTTLDSALNRCNAHLLFYLDIKVNGLGQADRLAELIKRHGVQAHVLIASSSIPFITYLEFRYPELNTVLEGFDKGEECTYWLFPKNFRPDFLSSFDDEVDEPHVAWLRDNGLLAHKLVYGMDSAGYVRMRAAGITRLIVDEGVPVIGP
jgi:glycerophosphoryl diester phosphodiesterase